MPKQNSEKQSRELIADSDIWLAIHNLDPDLRPERSQNTAYAVLMMVVVRVWLIWYSLHL